MTLHEVAPDWLRVRELALLLAASLQEVDNRWSDGKGPLALYFTGDEVAKLVTAMFEKTGRRDAFIVTKPALYDIDVFHFAVMMAQYSCHG